MNFTSLGALHIHTKYSDGLGVIPEIAAHAKKAGLSWIIITDHNCIDGLINNEEGWYDGVAVIVGKEISPKNSDHYLALDIKKEITPDLTPEEFINEVKMIGGFGFIAHPDENPNRKNNYNKPLRWTNWDIQGFHGLEIWNYMSDWTDNCDSKKVIFDYYNTYKILKGPTKNVLNWWDRLNNSNNHIIPAVGGIDAHGFKYNLFGINLTLFDYNDCFRSLTNCLHLENKLSESFEQAKSQIILALKNGNNSIINRIWDNSNKEFQFYIETEDKHVFPGSSVNFDECKRIIARLSRKADIRLIHNGELILEHKDNKLTFEELKPGKYRLEIFYKGKPWIFTNPVLILS